MKYEVAERIPEPVVEKVITLTLTTEELGLIVFAMKCQFDQYSGRTEGVHLKDDLAYLEGVVNG
jgi:hypothetical protein